MVVATRTEGAREKGLSGRGGSGTRGAGFVWDLDGLTEEAALMTRYFREV
jgi:hypothetical protein